MIITQKELTKIITNAIVSYLKDNPKTIKNNSLRINGNVPDLRNKQFGYNDSNYINSQIDTLQEGLIMTYDIRVTQRYVCTQCGLDFSQFQVDNRSFDGVVTPIITIVLPPFVTQEDADIISSKMLSCGYSPCTNIQYNKQYNCCAVVYEPKFGEDITEKIRNNYRYLFHATPSVYINKIKENGLCPMSKNGLFLYPNRVYCMKGNKLTKQQKKIYRNMQKVRASKIDFSNTKNIDDNTYCILTIDVNKLPENIIFRTDGMADGGIFTYDNIPPSAIVSYKKYLLSFDDIKNKIRKMIQRIN